MKKIFLFGLLLLASQFCAAEDEFQCDVYDAIRTHEADEVFSSCSDGSYFSTYVVRDNGGEWPAGTEFPIAGSTVPGLEVIEIPSDHVSLVSKTQPIVKPKALTEAVVAWLVLSGACYANHHVTIGHLRNTCGESGVRSMSVGVCGFGSSVRCK